VFNSSKAQKSNGSSHLKFNLLLVAVTIVGVLSVPLVVKSEPGVNLSAAFIKQMGKKYGTRAKLRLNRWQKLIKDLRNDSEQSKLKKVNDFFNKVRFLDDIKHWKKKDYWATPVEFLVTNGGDCEDFTIAKYYTLKALGVNMSKMSIAYVKALDYNQAHMVLTYYSSPRAEPVILDNLIPQIKRASKRKDLLHVYSFNGDNLWISKKGRRANLVGSSDKLGPWVQLKKRLKTQ
jgi:predicted transglutaminase-like cysteine proteinase